MLAALLLAPLGVILVVVLVILVPAFDSSRATRHSCRESAQSIP